MVTERIEKIRQNYVNAKPQISCERARIWTESHKQTEGLPVCIRRARAFYDCCTQLGFTFLRGELVVGAIGGVPQVRDSHPGVFLAVGGPGDGHL